MNSFKIEVEYDVETEEVKIKDLNSYDKHITYLIRSELDIISSIKDFIKFELKGDKENE